MVALVVVVVGLLVMASGPAFAQAPTSAIDVDGIDDVAGVADITQVAVEVDAAGAPVVVISWDETDFSAGPSTACGLANLNGAAEVGTALCVTVTGAPPTLQNPNPVGFGCDGSAADRCSGATTAGLLTSIPCTVSIEPGPIVGGGDDTFVRCAVSQVLTSAQLASGLIDACTFSGSPVGEPLDCVLRASAVQPTTTTVAPTTTTSAAPTTTSTVAPTTTVAMATTTIAAVTPTPSTRTQPLAFTGLISDLTIVLGAALVAAGLALSVTNPRRP